MTARGFKPVGWVAAVAGAALGCYMLSLNVAAERAELSQLERKIVAAKQDIRSLQTELGTRGRMAQLDRWNADVLALSSPAPAQFLDSALILARFDQRAKTIEERATVHLAAIETGPAAKAEAPIATADYAAVGARAATEPKSLVRHASLVVGDRPPASVTLAAAREPAFAKGRLLDDKLVAELGAVARTEKKAEGGTGGQ